MNGQHSPFQTRRLSRDSGSAPTSSTHSSSEWSFSEVFSAPQYQHAVPAEGMSTRGRRSATISSQAPSSYYHPSQNPPHVPYVAYSFQYGTPHSIRQSSAPMQVSRDDSVSPWMPLGPISQSPSALGATHFPNAPTSARSRMEQASSSEHLYLSAFERNQVPTWREQQYSGEIRRRELERVVAGEGYRRVVRSPRGSQGSRGSTRSNGATTGSGSSDSADGASAGSFAPTGRTQTCEFCGRAEMLSTLREHWLVCEHRAPVPESRQGVWIGRPRPRPRR